MANSNLMPFSPTDGDALFAGIDWSPPGGDYAVPADLSDFTFTSRQSEFDPPPVDLNQLHFPAPADQYACVNPNDLHSFQSVVFDGTIAASVPGTSPVLYTSQPEPTLPQRPAQSPPAHEHQAPKQRQKKVESGFPCHHPGCGQCFNRACDLRKHHQNKHAPKDKRKHQCPHCEQRFNWPKDVNRHCRQVHGHGASISGPPVSPSTDLSPAITRNSGSSLSTTAGDVTQQTSRTASSVVGARNAKKGLSEPPLKRQRRFLANLPGKLGKALWITHGVVRLKNGLRFRRKSSHSEEDVVAEDREMVKEEKEWEPPSQPQLQEESERKTDADSDVETDTDAPGEIVDEDDPRHDVHPDHAPPDHLLQHHNHPYRQVPHPQHHLNPETAIPAGKRPPSTQSAADSALGVVSANASTSATTPIPPPPEKRWLLVTPDGRRFLAVEVTGAATAAEVVGRVRRVTNVAEELELAMREFSFHDGPGPAKGEGGLGGGAPLPSPPPPLGDEALMRAVNTRAGDGGGLMLFLKAAPKGAQ